MARAADATSRTPGCGAVTVPSAAAAPAMTAPARSSAYGMSLSGPFHASRRSSRDRTGVSSAARMATANPATASQAATAAGTARTVAAASTGTAQPPKIFASS
jgi:hypothetical protein